MVLSTSCKMHPCLRNNNTGHNACLGLKQVACCSHQKTGTRIFLVASLTIQKQYPLTIALAKKRRSMAHPVHTMEQKGHSRGISGRPGVKTLTAGDARQTPGQGARLPHASWPKQNIKTSNIVTDFFKKGKNYSYTQHQR